MVLSALKSVKSAIVEWSRNTPPRRAFRASPTSKIQFHQRTPQITNENATHLDHLQWALARGSPT